jgi:hypothetical protein
MRIDVTLWYRLIRKGVITSNSSDQYPGISSRDSHYVVYDMPLSDGMPPREVGHFSSTNQLDQVIK